LLENAAAPLEFRNSRGYRQRQISVHFRPFRLNLFLGGFRYMQQPASACRS
jgi:hypothetical protein